MEQSLLQVPGKMEAQAKGQLRTKLGETVALKDGAQELTLVPHQKKKKSSETGTPKKVIGKGTKTAQGTGTSK